MGTPEKNSLSIVPQISKKLTYRTLFLVIVFGSLGGGLLWFMKVRGDLNGLHTTDTVGWIAAVEYGPQSQEAVLISRDGTIHKDPGHIAQSTDRDVVWSPKGNFLYYVSDRVDHNFNLFRWIPDSTEPAEQRTIGTRARSNLKFPAQPSDDSDNVAKGLITTGGLVQEFDPTNQSTEQILPPTSKEITTSKGGEEQGTEGQFEGYYGSLGTSFREAQWCNNHHTIVAVMRRDSGEILIAQDMKMGDGKFPPPHAIIAGDHIDFAVNPKDGNVIYCLNGFQWPDAASANAGPDGKKPKKPFINAVGGVDFEGKNFVIAANQGELTFGSPAISPDGATVVVILGKVTNGESNPIGMAIMPATDNSSFKRRQFKGDIHEPSWSPDGTRILAAVRLPGKPRTIFEIPIDGSPPRNVTGDQGSFGFPHYSPQTKAN